MQILELPRATGRHFRPPSRKKIAKELFRSLYPPEHRSPRDTISLLNITDKKRKYTDFWGPVSNFGIPVAAVLDTQKSPDLYVEPAASLLFFFPFPPAATKRKKIEIKES